MSSRDADNKYEKRNSQQGNTGIILLVIFNAITAFAVYLGAAAILPVLNKPNHRAEDHNDSPLAASLHRQFKPGESLQGASYVKDAPAANSGLAENTNAAKTADASPVYVPVRPNPPGQPEPLIDNKNEADDDSVMGFEWDEWFRDPASERRPFRESNHEKPLSTRVIDMANEKKAGIDRILFTSSGSIVRVYELEAGKFGRKWVETNKEGNQFTFEESHANAEYIVVVDMERKMALRFCTEDHISLCKDVGFKSLEKVISETDSIRDVKDKLPADSANWASMLSVCAPDKDESCPFTFNLEQLDKEKKEKQAEKAKRQKEEREKKKVKRGKIGKGGTPA